MARFIQCLKWVPSGRDALEYPCLLHSGRPPGAISMTTKGHVRVVGCRTVTPHTLKTRDSQTSPSSASVNEPENDQQDDGPDRRANDGGDNAVAEMDP